ncbi:hypothetical protein TNCV_831121 [Trichonephila clavipes]|nr:hypothetical protein TNCV_831121 [Trichonephila clavipes]
MKQKLDSPRSLTFSFQTEQAQVVASNLNLQHMCSVHGALWSLKVRKSPPDNGWKKEDLYALHFGISSQGEHPGGSQESSTHLTRGLAARRLFKDVIIDELIEIHEQEDIVSLELVQSEDRVSDADCGAVGSGFESRDKKFLSICATEVEEIFDLSEPMNSDSYAEKNSETPLKTVGFSSLHCMEIMKTYLMQQDVDNIIYFFSA